MRDPDLLDLVKKVRDFHQRTYEGHRDGPQNSGMERRITILKGRG
jgi:hypothetical protein